MRSLALAAAAAAVLLALAAPAHASTTLTDSAHGFTVRVPDGFVDFPDGHASPTYLYAWKRGEGMSFQMLVIADLGGELDEGPIDLDDFRHGLATGSTAQLQSLHQSSMTWKGSEIQVVAGEMSTNGTELGFSGAQVPLPDHAVMVSVFGTGAAPTLDATVREVMSSFDGENSWTSTRDRRIGWVVGAVGVVLGAVILFAKLESRRRRA